MVRVVVWIRFAIIAVYVHDDRYSLTYAGQRVQDDLVRTRLHAAGPTIFQQHERTQSVAMYIIQSGPLKSCH